MAIYSLETKRETLHGTLDKHIPPVLTIQSGDTVVFRTLEGDWRWDKPPLPASSSGRTFVERRMPGDRGHALCGPIYVEGARPGMTLKVSVERVVPYTWGWSRVGDGDPDHMARLGFSGEEHFLLWDLDVERRVCRSNAGHIVPMRPFMGVLTVTPDGDKPARTHLPGPHGGNLDCKEVVAGSALYLPVLVDGALFSTGDGHARQGDGELGCTAIECPMREVRLTFELLRQPFEMLACDAPSGWITFGFHEDLTRASYEALENMARLMERLYGFSRKEALDLSGAVVDMHVTQIVNGVRGAHAILPHDALFLEK